MIYLACPDTHDDSSVREQRFHAACRAAARLILAGQVVFCPVVNSHPLTKHGLPTEWTYWERVDRELLRVCDEVVVLSLDGWGESVGVRVELRLARAWGLPVRHRPPRHNPDGPECVHP